MAVNNLFFKQSLGTEPWHGGGSCRPSNCVSQVEKQAKRGYTNGNKAAEKISNIRKDVEEKGQLLSLSDFTCKCTHTLHTHYTHRHTSYTRTTHTLHTLNTQFTYTQSTYTSTHYTQTTSSSLTPPP